MDISKSFEYAEALRAVILVCMGRQPKNLSNGASNLLEKCGAIDACDGVEIDREDRPRMIARFSLVLLACVIAALAFVIAFLSTILQLVL